MKKILFSLLAILFISLSSFAQTSTAKLPPEKTVRGFLILADHGCYTILINIYETQNGQTFLVSSTTVCVGACGKFSPINNNKSCEDFVINDESFYNSKFNYDYCASDLLRESTTYEKYLDAKNAVLATVKE